MPLKSADLPDDICWEMDTSRNVDLLGSLQLSLVHLADLHVITTSYSGVEISRGNR